MLRSITNKQDNVFNAVIYVRVSTDEQAKDGLISLNYQRDKCIEWINNQEGAWNIIEVFEEDISGFKFDRPEMDVIRDLAKRGKINALVVLRRNRFARGEEISMMLERVLSKNGVRLFSVVEGEFTPGVKNRIVSAVERAMSEQEAVSLVENMTEKRRAYIKNGAAPSQGAVKYGYNKVGKKGYTRYVVNEVEAETIRLMYDMYLKSFSLLEIAEYLNNQGIPQPSARMTRDGSREMGSRFAKTGWKQHNVSHILRDVEVYHGNLTVYTHAYREDAPDPFVISIPTIISDDLYEKVKYAQETRKSFPQRKHLQADRKYLLSGKFNCQCGYAILKATEVRNNKNGTTAISYRYRCTSTMKAHAKECHVRYIPAIMVETIVWDFIKSLLEDPRASITRYKQQQKEHKQYLDNALTHIETIRELLQELSAERDQTIKLYKKRLIDDSRLEADMVVIDRQINKLEVEKDKWIKIVEDQDVSDSQLGKLETIAREVKDALEDLDMDEKITILEKLRVKVTADKENGVWVFYISLLGSAKEKLKVNNSSEDDTSTVDTSTPR